MKKILFCLLVVTTGCVVTNKKPRFDYVSSGSENPCISAFKDRVFFAILMESYKNTAAFDEIKKVDVFNPFDGLPFSIQLKIDSIGKNFVKNMPRPPFCDECKPEQNYYMAQALHFYESRQLDSIAKAELGKYTSEICK